MEPKISVNKLGEYMTASPSRRKQIVKDQKNPPTFKVARYKNAREAIVNFIESGMADDEKAISIAIGLRNDHSGTEFAVTDRALSADAIESFLEVPEEIEIDDLSVQACNKFVSNILELGGTKVSMRLDALLTDPGSGKVVGCVKLYFSKSSPLTVKGAEYVATALRAHLEQNLSTQKNVDPSKCYVVDVAARIVTSAPKANIRRLNDLFAACEEIKGRWDSV